MLLGNATAVAMFAIGLLLMVVILMRRFRALTRRSRRADPHKAVKQVRGDAERRFSKRDVPLSGAPNDANRWSAEMHELARDTRAEIDTKIRLLQATMREAESQAHRLQALIQRAETFQLGSDQAVVDEIDRLTETLERAGELERPVGAGPPSDRGSDEIPEELREEVKELMSTGLSAHYVANQTGLPIGDVEMIVSLSDDLH